MERAKEKREPTKGAKVTTWAEMKDAYLQLLSAPAERKDIVSRAVELEAVIKVDWTSWKAIHATLMKMAPAQERHSVINSENRQSGPAVRLEKDTSPGVKNEFIAVEKARVAVLMREPVYKLRLATESQLRAVPALTAGSIWRLRRRWSFSLEQLPDWRIDMTLVMTVEDAQRQQLVTLRDAFVKVDWRQWTDHYLRHPYKAELELEYVGGKTADNIREDVIETFLGLVPLAVDDTGYMLSLNRVARLLGHREPQHSFKRLVKEPITLYIADWQTKLQPTIDKFWVSDKADGERALLVAEAGELYLLTAHRRQVLTWAPDWKVLTGAGTEGGATVCDCEVLSDGRVFLFDLLRLRGEDWTTRPYDEREVPLAALATALDAKRCQKKPSEKLTAAGAGKQIAAMYARRRSYPIDGLIFTGAEGSYQEHTVYKWKQPDENTVDFLVMQPPAELLGTPPYEKRDKHTLYLLFCTINEKTRRMLGLQDLVCFEQLFRDISYSDKARPIHFSPPSYPNAYLYQHPGKDDLHMHVCEMIWTGVPNLESSVGVAASQPSPVGKKGGGWRFVKLRPDKDAEVRAGQRFGNAYRTIEAAFDNYATPLTLEVMTGKKGGDETNGQYFAQQKLPQYRALTKFNNFVKAQLLRQTEYAGRIVDLCCGQGQDLFTYAGYQPGELVCIDRDEEALRELNRRRHDFDKAQLYRYSAPPKTYPALKTAAIDLAGPADTVIKSLRGVCEPASADFVVMNFALHYFADSIEHLRTVRDYVDLLLRPGGVAIFTCFSGELIWQLLKDTAQGSSYDLLEAPGDNAPPGPSGDKKYSIRRDYAETELLEAGQQIAVIHPFSAGQYYPEYLVNTTVVQKLFTELDYQVRQTGSFANWLAAYRGPSLSENDRRYAGLYTYLSFWKPPVAREKKTTKKNQLL